MPKFRVINTFRERTVTGDHSGRTIYPGEEFIVGGAEMERLLKANCIVPLKEIEVEKTINKPPETQTRRGRRARIVR